MIFVVINNHSIGQVMIDEKVFIRAPLNFKNKCNIYPPSVRDVIANEKFSQYKMILTISQEELEDNFLGKDGSSSPQTYVPTPLEFLLNNCYYSKEFRKLAEEAFYFFTKEKIDFSFFDKRIIIGDLENQLLLINNLEEYNKIPSIAGEEEFFELQNMIRQSMGEKKIEPPNPDEDPRVKRIKAKARYRDKIKAQKGLGISLGTTLASICCMGLGITPLNIGEMSYVAMESLTRKYQEKEKYELDIDSLLAGADSKKVKPKYWIINLDF